MPDPITLLNTALDGRYRIESELGEGGWSKVYLADDLKHGRKVALKVLKAEVAAAVGAERFLTEITTTANLQHPHILPLFDSGEAGGFLFYVMPYVQGETMRDRLDREKQLPIDEAVRIASDVAEALQYAHEQGVIHRDVKPGNILLNRGRPVVSDFGIAFATGAAGGRRATEAGVSMGTPYYMSPEQASADREPTARSDVYSLGCVLYEMLVGEPPFTGSSGQTVLARLLTEPTPSSTRHRTSIPPNVDAALTRALEKLPADRFPSARDFSTALNDPGYRYGVKPEKGVTSRRGRWDRTTGLLGATSLGLATALVWTVRQPPPSTGVLRYELSVPLETNNENDYGSQVALSPDGARLVYSSGIDGQTKLWTRLRDVLEPFAIPGSEGGHQPFFSPDGRHIGFITFDRRIRIVPLEGGQAAAVLDSGVVRSGAAWGRDGYIYVQRGTTAGVSTDGLGRVPSTGGPIEAVTRYAADEVGHFAPTPLPGGRGLIFGVDIRVKYAAANRRIAVADLQTGEHRILFPGVMARWLDTGHILWVTASGEIYAQAFDEERLRLEGAPVRLDGEVDIEDFGSADIAVSRNGTLVYAASGRGDNARLVLVARDGAAQYVDSEWVGAFEHPRISPEGQALIVGVKQGRESQLWTRSLERGGRPSRFTFEGGVNQRAAWSPDGAYVAFISDWQGGHANVFLRPAGGTAAPVSAFTVDAEVEEVIYSRDGRELIYRLGMAVFAHRVDGVEEPTTEPIVSPAFQIAISPDGRMIAFVATGASGISEVFVQPFPNVSDGRWQVSTNGGYEPVWAPDSRELFYRNPTTGELRAVEVLQGGMTRTGPSNVLFASNRYLSSLNSAAYDVAPDGRFLMVEGNSGLTRLIFVENLSDEIRQRIGGR